MNILKKFFNEKLLQRFKKENRKGLSLKTGFKKATPFVASTMLLATLAGCAPQANLSETPTEQTQETTDTLEETSQQETDAANQQASYEYTQEMWDEFEQQAWDSVNGKINNTNRESFAAALKVFNIQYLDLENPDILINYYAKGIDQEYELNQAYNILSQIREYNTTIDSADEFYSFKNLLVSQVDKSIIGALEDLAREFKGLDLKTETGKARAEEIFTTIYNFSNGTGKLAVAIGGEIIEVAQIDLTDGAIMASENIMQDISVMSQNIIPEEKRAELDKTLRTQDALARIQEIMTRNGAIASVTVSQANDEDAQKAYDNIVAIQKYLVDEVAPMGVTEEESNALFVVANIDYFMSTANNQKAFSMLFEEGIDLNEIFGNAEAAVEKIETYNRQATSEDQVYKYGHYIISSKEDIISVNALISNFRNLKSNDQNVVSEAVEEIKGYTQYSSESIITYHEVNDDGTVKPDVIKLDKNALTKGGNQLVDWITFYNVKAYQEQFGEELSSYLMELVSNPTNGITPTYDIILMVDNYCAENNIAKYDYQTGNVKTLK